MDKTRCRIHRHIICRTLCTHANIQKTIPSSNYGHHVDAKGTFIIEVLSSAFHSMLNMNEFTINCTQTIRKVPQWVYFDLAMFYIYVNVYNGVA